MELLTSLFIGLGLSAACGFRVFVPPLVMSAASLSGQLTLGPEFAWIGTYPALIAFGVATVFEVGGYYIPWLDNLLDTIATPAAVVAGTVMTASMVSDMGPLLAWSVAIIGGGGVAGVVQGATVLIRGTSTATTAGLGNPGVSTGEAVGSVGLSVLAIAFMHCTTLAPQETTVRSSPSDTALALPISMVYSSSGTSSRKAR